MKDGTQAKSSNQKGPIQTHKSMYLKEVTQWANNPSKSKEV